MLQQQRRHLQESFSGLSMNKRWSFDKLEHEKLPNNPRQRGGQNVARLLDVFHAEKLPKNGGHEMRQN